VSDRPRILESIALPLALVLAAAVLAGGAMRIADSRAAVTVTGSARKQIRSDLVIWRGTFSAQAPALADAYGDLARQMNQVRAYLTGKGLPDSALVFSAVNTRTFFVLGPRGNETSAISGYRLFQTVEVRSRDVERITLLAREATELIQQGVAFESNPPEYLYTKLADLKVEMLADATRDAKARAQEMARNSGARIGRLRGARMGVFQITPAFSNQVADYGFNDTSSLLKDITAVVSMSFEIR
jgi:hypothetical protein